MNNFVTDSKVILASGSPYRRRQLEQIGIAFEAMAPVIDESPRQDETGLPLANRLAAMKAQTIAQKHPGAIVIGSDQVGICDNRLLSKPGTQENALEQLTFCSGKAATFYSAVTVVQGEHIEHAWVETQLQFKALTTPTILNYLQLDEPWDCAGSFKVEAHGIALFDRITSNDPSALVGLPLIATVGLLAKFGIDPLG